MCERPILFKPELVRGILAAAGLLDAPPKLQTRRIVTEIKDHDRARLQAWDPFFGVATFVDAIPDDPVPLDIPCRYGAEGDKLWVREIWQPIWADDVEPPHGLKSPEGWAIGYPATDGRQEYYDSGVDGELTDRCKPGIHMPRWASRITLTLAEVRVERLQDITHEDAIAEGIEAHDDDGVTYYGPLDRGHSDPRIAFSWLWDKINAKRATWESNPWTWVLRWERSGIEVRR